MVSNEKGKSLFNISVANVTHSQIELTSNRQQTISIRVAGRTMAPGIGAMSSPITLSFGKNPGGFYWNESYTWILAIIGAFVWVLLILLAFLITKRWFSTNRKTTPRKIKQNFDEPKKFF